MIDPDDQAEHTPFGFAVSGCYREFLDRRGNPENVLVATTLRSGRQFLSLGLWIQLVEDVTGCVMVQGGPDSSEAIVVRDDDIASVEFRVLEETEPDEPTPFGFYPRTAS